MTKRRHKVFVDGQVHIRASQCRTCIFGPRSPVSTERRDEMVAGATSDEVGSIVCHHHLYQGEPVEPVCRGFYDRHAGYVLRLAVAMGVVKWVGDQ